MKQKAKPFPNSFQQNEFVHKAQKNCFKAKSKNKLKVFLVEIYYN